MYSSFRMAGVSLEAPLGVAEPSACRQSLHATTNHDETLIDPHQLLVAFCSRVLGPRSFSSVFFGFRPPVCYMRILSLPLFLVLLVLSCSFPSILVFSLSCARHTSKG